MNLPEDQFVRDLLPEFIESWLNDIDYFHTFKAANNKDDLYRMAHTIKGSCYQFGLNDIAELGIELMKYASIPDWKNAEDLQKKIKMKFIEVDEYLKNNLV